MFLFSSIPGSLLFDSYINTRSKYILIDEIKMQHSLILAFISLGDTNYEINIMTIIEFFHYIYQDRVRCIDAITQVCLKLNNDGNCSVVNHSWFSMSSSSFNLEEFFRKIPIYSLLRCQIYLCGYNSDQLLTIAFLWKSGWKAVFFLPYLEL